MELKKRWAQQPAAIIKGLDPVAVPILKQIYSALKDRGENLGLHEQVWVREIEKVYSDKDTFDSFFINGLSILIQQALNVLEKDNLSWDVKPEELYHIFQRLIFLKARDGVFKPFFDDVEQVIFTALKGDFSKRVNLIKIGQNHENMLSYAAVMLNTLLESLQVSAVSASAVNDIIEQMNGSIVIITDTKNRIKFVSRKGEQLLKGNENSLLGTDLNAIINFQANTEEGLPKLKAVTIKLKDQKIIQGASLLAIPGGGNAKDKEITYLIDLPKNTRRNSAINLNNIIDNFFEACNMPQITKVEIIKEIYTFGYKGNKASFIKLVNLVMLFAVKDAEAGKPNIITVHFSEILPKKFNLRISYTGKGYKKRQIPEIFENELKLMKEYCDELDGRISIQSQYLGKTIITMILPSYQ